MAYLSDDALLDTEGGFTGWDDGTGAGTEETLEQALAEERLAELEMSWSRTSIPSTIKQNWRTRKKKPPRSVISG